MKLNSLPLSTNWRQLLKTLKTKRPDGKIMHPTREWLVCISFALLLFSGSIWWSIHIYRSYSTVVFESKTPEQETNVVYRTQDVESALQLFETKQTDFTELRNSLLTPGNRPDPDTKPSLPAINPTKDTSPTNPEPEPDEAPNPETEPPADATTSNEIILLP